MTAWGFYLFCFLLGTAWMMAGMAVFSIMDPEGEVDDLVMGEDYALMTFFRSLLFWPLTAWVIHQRRSR